MTVPRDLSLHCSCGATKGVARSVQPQECIRVICMCDDCQTYAHFLERADEILDGNGGTEIVQITPSQVEIQEGFEQLRCMRLSPKGGLRWYTACCRTPVANMAASAKMPIVGIPHLFMDAGPEPDARDQALGPVYARVMARYGHGEIPPQAHQKFPAGLILRTIRMMASSRVRGRHRPTPFFDAAGKPVVTPEVISIADRARLRQAAEAQP